VVDQQELHVPVLGLVGDRRGDLGLHHHPGSDLERAGGLRLGDRPAVAGVGDLDQALSAGADRVEQRMVAEPWNLGADQLGGPDHQSPLRHAHLDVVDGQRDQVFPLRDIHVTGHGHRLTLLSAGSVERALLCGRSNEQTRSSD